MTDVDASPSPPGAATTRPGSRPARARRTGALGPAFVLVALAWSIWALRLGVEPGDGEARSVARDSLGQVHRLVTGGLPRHVRSLAITLAFALEATILGAAVLRLLRLEVGRLEELALGFAVGHLPVTAVVLVVGHTIGLSTTATVGSHLLAAAVGVAVLQRRGGLLEQWRGFRLPSRRRILARPGPGAVGGGLLLGVLGALLAIPLVGSLSPEVNWDAKWYHLGPARHYVLNGRFYNLVEESRMAVTALGSYQEFLYTGLFSAHGEITSKLLSFVQLLGICALLVASARRFLGSWRVGAVAAAAYAALPIVTWSATTAYNDIPMALGTLAAFHLVLRWRDDRRPGVLVLAGLVVGWVVGVKLFGVFTLAGLGLVVVLSAAPLRPPWRDAVRPILRHGTTFTVAAGLAYAPALVRSWALTGNPVFPLLEGVFDSPYWNDVAVEYNAQSLREVSFLRLPVLLARLPYDVVTDADRMNSLLGPMLLVLLLPVALGALLFGRRSDRVTWPAGVTSLVWVALWLKSGVSDSRYLIGILPVLLLGGAAVVAGTRWPRPSVPAAALGVPLAALVVVGWQPVAPLLAHAEPTQTAGVAPVFWDYVYGDMSAEDIQLRWLPVIAMVNAEVPSDAKVYDAAIMVINYLYLEADLFNGSAYDGPYGMEEWSLCNDDAPWRLAEEDVTHVVILANDEPTLERAAVAPYLDEVERLEGAAILYSVDLADLPPEPADVDRSFCVFFNQA